MKARQAWFCSSVAVVAVALGASVMCVTPVRGQEEKAAKAQGGGENPLHHEMEAMGKAFKALRGQVSDPAKNESSLQLVEELERHTLAAKALTPRGATTRPTDERAKYVADYRTDMANVLRVELEVEEALLDGKNDKAAEAVKTLADMMGEGHKEFRPKRKRG